MVPAIYYRLSCVLYIVQCGQHHYASIISPPFPLVSNHNFEEKSLKIIKSNKEEEEEEEEEGTERSTLDQKDDPGKWSCISPSKSILPSPFQHVVCTY